MGVVDQLVAVTHLTEPERKILAFFILYGVSVVRNEMEDGSTGMYCLT